MFSWFFNSSKGEGGEAPRFVLPLSPIRASDGEPTKLICTLTGKPIPQITWYCGQREIRPSRDFQPAFEPATGAASLTIAEVFPDDEGVYRCQATNTHGTAECEAPLTVGDMIVVSHQELVRAPVIAQPLEPDRVETGSRKVMTIRFDGYPTPEVKWYHNGREIQQTENRLVTTFKNESTLVVVRCDADSAGKYEARAMNEGGEARTSASIQLTDGKATAQKPPKFRKALRPQIVPESEAIVMEVEVDSAPECVFSWKQHGQVVRNTEAMQIVTQNNRSTLFIPESFVENSGIYTVKAENAAGSVASTATLTVERQLLAEEFTPPFIVKELPQTKVMDGEEVRLICQVNGTPMPRIKWYHNGQPVREHNGVMMSLSPQGEAVLRLAEAFPEDAGVYECKAVNRAGQITTSTTLQVERYEYIPDSESASITAGPSVGTWEDLTGPSGSEDDLLSDKPVVNKKSVKTKTEKKSAKFQPQESKEEELVQDSGSAPRFVVALPRQVDVKDGQQARFEVKVESYPRPSVFWYLNGKEIQPSKDFGIDHLEDGTSILTLGEVFPDDAGELMCEAHNDKGVVTSITHLNVTEYKDTPTYRKPEWVTKMEIVRAQMLESIQPPQFTTEIVDARVQEGEEAKFECHYAGNPKPDICWYFNNKLLNPNPNIKIRITDNTTSCAFLEVDQDLEGEYMCKATSNSGSHVTKARLHVHELTGEAKQIWMAKKAKVEEEKVRVKKEKEDKKHKKDKGAKLTKEEYLKQAMHEKELAKAEEAKKLAAVEEAKLAKEEAEKQPKPEVKINKAKAQREAMIEEGLSKFVESQALGLKALLEMTERKSLNVTEVVAQDKAKEFVPDEAPFKEFVQIETMLKSGVTVDQIVTLGALGNLPTLTAPETQKALVRLVEDQGFRAVVLQGIVKEVARLAPEEPIGMKAVLKAIETKSANMEDIVVMATHPEEFNLEAHPVPEMATVSTLLNEGISCEEMLTIVKAGELPALNLPENQWALVQIMDKLGQTAIVSQVIVEEPALNLPAEINEIPQTVEERLDKFVTNQSIGLRALIDLSIQESINVSEMATLDRVQEFPPDQAPFQEFVNIDTMLKSGVKVDQIVALGSTGNLPVLTAPETQKALVRIVEDHGSRAIVREITVKEAAKLLPEEAIGLKAVLKAVKTKKADIKNIVEMAIHPEEFGLEATPVPEMASVSTLLHEGISCEEMLTIVKAGELPALKLPETQWPLIQIMDRLGQTAMVSQTIIEEPMLGLKIEIPELATSVESTVEPLSTAVAGVLPDVRAEPAHEFTAKIKDLEIKERQPAVFTAEVSDEKAQVTWHKDGEPLDQTNTERYEFLSEALKRSFTIRSVTLQDEGEYTCSLAEQECTAELVVIELPPEITLRLKDVTVRRGEEASFEIELTKGDAKIQWFRNSEEIQLSEHIQLAIDGKRQRLVIYDSGPEDACEYSCVIGDQKSAAQLTVLAPRVNFVAKLPEVVAAPMGQDVTFTVQLTGEEADVTWMKNGEVVVESDRIKLIRDGCARSLTITKATIGDSAEYTCVLEAMKTVTVLTVEVPKVPPSIPIDQVHAEVWVRRGEDAVIEIPFNGFPTPKAEWTFKGKAIRKTKKSVYTISETSAQLTLKLVDENEAGVYTCKLSNECGDVSVSVTIKLMEKPCSPSVPECLETADDSITIMWKPPGYNGGSTIINYIVEYQEKQTKKWITANKDVVITETTYMVTRLTHNTEYRFRVTAVNTVGPGTPSSESLLYKAAKAAIPEAPVIREPLKDLTAGLKETATLSCIIVGVPQPTLRWFKDDDEFVPKSSSYESGLARLILNNTNEESAGQYSCRASNDSGSCECSCTLIIQEAPKIVPEKKTKVYRLQIEKQWSITAKVTGLPRPDVTWTKNGASIEGNTHYIADVETQSSTACSTTLTIINTERTDTAKYTLTATNVAGTVTHDVTLKISDKPSKPQGPLVAKEVDKTSATMEWKPPLDDGGIELKGYIVEYSEIFTEQWKRVEELSANTICHVQNLTEGLEYVFRVSAVNDVGTSEPLDTGAPVLIKCQFDTPSAPRGPLEFSGMTDTSLVLHWFPPASDGGSPLTEYLVERREVSKKAWQKVGTSDGKTTHIEALGLKQGTSYNFRMTAQNQLGYGPAFTPEDVIVAGKRITPPSPPSNLQVADITSRSVTLQWAPPISTGGAELTGYIIEKMLSGTDKWEKVVTLDPSVTVHCIQNLKERSEFFFRVLTENPMGLSAPAETGKVALKTHATVPSPPTSPLEVRPVGPNSIIVEWGIPESDGGAAIDGYIVAVRDSRKTMWMEVGQVGADTTRLIVKDMQEGHKYYVRVFARNEVGLSEPLETEEPVKVIRPPDYLEPGIAGPAHKDPTASLSLSTETLSSWMRDANMDADIRIYSRSSLLRRDEYFFRVWYYSRQLFK